MIDQDNMVYTCIYKGINEIKTINPHIVVYTILPRKSSRGSCPATAMGSRMERAMPFFFLALVSHTMGCTPGLARAWRCGLDAMWMTGVLQSMGLPKMRDTISLFTGAVSGMGISNKSIKTSRTEARCLAKARFAGLSVGAQNHRV